MFLWRIINEKHQEKQCVEAFGYKRLKALDKSSVYDVTNVDFIKLEWYFTLIESLSRGNDADSNLHLRKYLSLTMK